MTSAIYSFQITEDREETVGRRKRARRTEQASLTGTFERKLPCHEVPIALLRMLFNSGGSCDTFRFRICRRRSFPFDDTLLPLSKACMTTASVTQLSSGMIWRSPTPPFGERGGVSTSVNLVVVGEWGGVAGMSAPVGTEEAADDTRSTRLVSTEVGCESAISLERL